jgi:predicted nucleic-acid-binding protein
LAARATAALAAADELLLADLVVAECVYVLESFYEVSRERVAELVRAAIALPSIRVIDHATLLRRSRSTRWTAWTSPRRTWSHKLRPPA